MKNIVFESFPPNHLAGEKSPYLLQHTHQPVDWYPWGDTAFEKAKATDRPLLVSIGYATCHWCHVMAEEAFSDPEIAALMNRYFVCVKIDREERPDLDQIYITAVSALTGGAGWPLNVFLTPDGKPFFGGTYFPPESRHGLPAWRDVVLAIGRAWDNPAQRLQLFNSAASLTEALKKNLAWQTSGGSVDVDSVEGLLAAAVDSFSGAYDEDMGGFSRAPKFPMPTVLNFLLFYHRFLTMQGNSKKSDDRALKMAVHTLEKMAEGGIRDHIGGGFHRYSTDAVWHIPHFEKMLYDNAQIATCYLKAFEITGIRRFAVVAAEALDYVLRDMTRGGGGFYSAEDADSEVFDPVPNGSHVGNRKAEGAFYVWRLKEVESVLGTGLAKIFAYRYGIEEKGNAGADPFGEFAGKNILYHKRSVEDVAEHFNRTPDEIASILDKARGDLFTARQKRPRPHRDDKILVEWNGLMISALATAYRLLEDEKYLLAARRAAWFIQRNLFDPDAGALYRRWRDGDRRISGMASDYAFLIQGLLDLYDAAFDPEILAWAIEMAHGMIQRFYDASTGDFFTTGDGHDPHLLFKSKEATDGVLPAAASVAALSNLRLYRLTGNNLFLNISEDIVTASLQHAASNPEAVPYLLVAAGSTLLKAIHVVICGRWEASNTQEMIRIVRSYPADNVQVVLIRDRDDKRKLSQILPQMMGFEPVDEGATAHVCAGQTCRSPVSDPEALDRLLMGIFNNPIDA